MIKWLSVFLIISIPFSNLHSQCCSAGSPAGVGTYAGMVSKKSLRITTFFRFTHSAGEYSKDSPLDHTILVKQSNFLFQGLNVSYGIIKQLSAEVELGYFYLKDQTYKNGFYSKGYGFSNGVLMLKTMLLHSDSLGFDISAGAGLKFPFGRQLLKVDNVVLGIDLQPSTHAFGVVGQLFTRKVLVPYKMSLYTINRFEYNFKNILDYRFGSRFRTSVLLERNFRHHIGAMLQLRYEYASHDVDFRTGEGIRFQNSGSSMIYITPLVRYSISNVWHLSVSADIPVYKYYQGIQLSNKYSLALNLTRDFSLCRKKVME